MLVSADVESSPSMTTSISADFAAAAAPALCALRSAFNGAIQTHQGGPTGGESSATASENNARHRQISACVSRGLLCPAALFWY